MGRPGLADDVVDPDGVVPLRGEHLGPGVEQTADGALPAGPQFPPFRRRAVADGPIRGQSPFSRMKR